MQCAIFCWEIESIHLTTNGPSKKNIFVVNHGEGHCDF